MTLPARSRSLSAFDLILVVLFLLGFYSGYTLKLTPSVPIPDTLSGIAGIVMLLRRIRRITPVALSAFALVLAIYLLSVVAAPDYNFLPKRVTGLMQVSYSLTICYGLFLTLTDGNRRQIAGLFLTFCLLILAGALAEEHLGLRPYSDAFRERVYAWNIIYEQDARDLLFYGRIRPKVFTSEPSAVTFSYTLFCFVWLVVSRWPWKLPLYLGVLFPVGMFGMPGPTLLIMLVLLIPYRMFAPSADGQVPISAAGLIQSALLGTLLIGLAIVIAQAEFSTRMHSIATGEDPSFFFREIGPILVAKYIFMSHPLTGCGLAGENYLQNEVFAIYDAYGGSSGFWHNFIEVKDALTNYFWLHWICLGVFFGIATLVALTLWLKRIGTASTAFCWTVWAIMGQAAGAYVSPLGWGVLLMAAAACTLLVESAPNREAVSLHPVWRMPQRDFGRGMSVVLRRT